MTIVTCSRQPVHKLVYRRASTGSRHTVSVMMTFSRNRSLTRVVAEADAAMQAHPEEQQGARSRRPTRVLGSPRRSGWIPSATPATACAPAWPPAPRPAAPPNASSWPRPATTRPTWSGATSGKRTSSPATRPVWRDCNWRAIKTREGATGKGVTQAMIAACLSFVRRLPRSFTKCGSSYAG